MTSHRKTQSLWMGVSFVLATIVVGAPAASASTATLRMRTTPAPRLTLFADNVVVTPGATAPAAPAPAAPASQTVVVPQSSQPAAAAPAEQPRTRKDVHADVSGNHNYMTTLAVSALMGGLAGALVGGALHYIDNGQAWRNVGYWAAGGVLVGAGVGVVQLMVQENRVSDAVSSNHFPTDPAPTFRLALMNVHF